MKSVFGLGGIKTSNILTYQSSLLARILAFSIVCLSKLVIIFLEEILTNKFCMDIHSQKYDFILL